VLLPPLLSCARKVRTPGSPHDDVKVGKPLLKPELPVSMPKIDLPKPSEVVKAMESDSLRQPE
jgi:hypothetical protein